MKAIFSKVYQAHSLDKSEKDELVTNCDWFETMKHSTVMPYAFTEQGVAMLSSVLKSPTAVEVNIQTMRAFVAMRHFLQNNAKVFSEINTIKNVFFALVTKSSR